MMLKRKINDKLNAWKKNKDRLPLVIEGARQVGKTTAVREFAKNNYETFYEVNFVENPDFVSIFSNSLDPSRILTSLSVAFPDVKYKKGSTLIFLDEIQHCPNGRSALKFLARDSRFDVIASGSLLGINHPREVSFPVGYTQNIELLPLDFEEFLWAMKINEEVISYLYDCFEKRTTVEKFVHESMLSYFSTYLITGGMPAVIYCYANMRDYSDVLEKQREIIEGYKRDVVKYAEENEKPRILRTFDSIPAQLAKDYKKFQYSVIDKGARAREYGGSLLWLKDAGIVSFCRNLSSLQVPLTGFAIDDEFKVYMNDTGLLVSMYESGTAKKILDGNLGLYKGALYENIIAVCLRNQGFPLFYFSPSSSLEIDFVIIYGGEPFLVEVKSGENNKSKSLNTVLSTEKYGVNKAIRFSRNNIGESGNILSLPLYMAMFLNPDASFDNTLPDSEEILSHIHNV